MLLGTRVEWCPPRVFKHRCHVGSGLMFKLRNLRCVVVAVALLAAIPRATAEDVLKVVVAQEGAWDLAAPRLGQLAGIFTKHGVALELSYLREGDSELISGSADIALGADILSVLRAYDRGEPVRIIGASTTGSANYWYVPAASPIKTISDIRGGRIAYPTAGERNRYDVFDFMNQFRIKARLVATGGEASTFKAVMSGQVDVGCATPPFGVDAIEQGQLRVVARANDVPRIRDETDRVIITRTELLQSRRDALANFMQAYRETIEWMYSDPGALKQYAELARLSEGIARRLRDEFFPKSMLLPDKINGLKTIIKDAARLNYTRSPLASKQIEELVQIEAVRSVSATKGFFLFRR